MERKLIAIFALSIIFLGCNKKYIDNIDYNSEINKVFATNVQTQNNYIYKSKYRKIIIHFVNDSIFNLRNIYLNDSLCDFNIEINYKYHFNKDSNNNYTLVIDTFNLINAKLFWDAKLNVNHPIYSNDSFYFQLPFKNNSHDIFLFYKNEIIWGFQNKYTNIKIYSFKKKRVGICR